ncbi:abortive infection family protein [Xanthomonas citri pv. citri]|uniref:abortive infection family protein n=1 Tax=Xanthomonas citri TaxID=346 RepID=UPI0036DD50C8
MESKALDAALATVHDLLAAEGKNEAARLVRAYPARVAQVGYDHWNGGTELWDVYFDVPPAEYASLRSRRDQIEEQITARLKIALEPDVQAWYAAKILPRGTKNPDWRAESPELPRGVRLNIVDGLRLDSISWRGRLDDVEFLSRLYDLEQLPSNDSRFADAAGDIWQHRINNDDWDENWIFSDSRFDLVGGAAEKFLRFLCETVHPVVRPDKNEAARIVSYYNDQLRLAGWEIVEEERIGGRPRFTYRRLNRHGDRAVSRARTVADALDAGWMAKAIMRLERSIDADPELAIGTAKDLVESCCKTILSKRGIDFGKSADLNDLTKLLAKEIRLVPEGISDEARGAENIRLVLRNLTQLTNNLAQLRGLYGSGHGRDGKHRGLQPRHARLAATAAIAFIEFVAETHMDRGAD